ncbi:MULTISPECIES: glycosyltransferase family 2 protein [Methanobrevibacter]|uniref:Glycosyltransferase, GT2 family n=1 Tax=Methanobrevibacter smithii (strain ATCC 35061 / DSM 861 / OCM 144 / PS) TaxID=420247 RepID=A5UMT7_METS3|nr:MULTISPECIES: glycosyltransferase family 2 protein [Methanobrevibacter]ABQ87515.1 glycosyltransferase, GT2 family [Methanobrevibacter smithii ATCC 35061]OED06207.1 glycosyl transferase [Methanobrevibacter sp. A54]
MPQISVVVPVYNVEKYLRECLDSLANQTFEDFEVICVNDGSDDSSPDILEEYASEDERFKIVSQENKGLSGARNTGMNYIKGRYLLFLDSDDWLELNALELLYNHANALNSEMVIFPYRYFNQETKQYEENDFTKLNMFDSSVDNKNFNYKNIPETVFRIPHESIKLYDVKTLKKLAVKFPEGLNYEDAYFFYKIFFKLNKVSIIRTPIYNYRIRNDSICTTGTEKSFDIFKILTSIKNFLKEDEIYESFKDEFILFTVINLKFVYLRLDERFRDRYLEKIKKNYEFFSLNQVNKNHLATWHFDDRAFYQAIDVSNNGIEFELNYKKLYYEFLANHYEGVIEQLCHENQVLAQENNDLKEQSADTSIKSKFKKIVKL